MGHNKLLAVLMVTGISMVYGAGLPKGLDGEYSEKNNLANCAIGMADLTITKNYFSFGTVSGCEVKSVKNTGKNTYTLGMLCASEGDEFKSTNKLKIMNKSIEVDGTVYESCKAAASMKTCIVPQGNAGVTTFLDNKLKKQGTSVRDFDNYEFKATDKIKVGKTDVLVGKLVSGDEVLEATSYAYADEWECK